MTTATLSTVHADIRQVLELLRQAWAANDAGHDLEVEVLLSRIERMRESVDGRLRQLGIVVELPETPR